VIANRQHPTVALTVGDGLVIDVDEELAAIVDLLWTVGIRTSSCCQETQPGLASIAPLTLADMEKLYEVLTALDLHDDSVDPDDDPDDHEPLFYTRGWEWSVWADGGLRSDVLIPRTELSWVKSRLDREAARLPRSD
jgi:hypothetical protein